MMMNTADTQCHGSCRAVEGMQDSVVHGIQCELLPNWETTMYLNLRTDTFTKHFLH